MILVNSGAFLSISSWFCELTELIFVMIPYIYSNGYPPKRKGLWVCASSEYRCLLKTGSLDNDSRVFIGLAIMVYAPLYHDLQKMASVCMIFWAFLF